MTTLCVAAGILINDAGEVLIAERMDGPFTGLWEFPGGKIDADEGASDALVRELQEELGVTVKNAEPLMAIDHAYPDRDVALEFFVVRQWQGEPRSIEGQALRWQSLDELDPRELLPANGPVVAALHQLLR